MSDYPMLISNKLHSFRNFYMQRYEFSSKSQLRRRFLCRRSGCCCYRKGTNFQANHNFHSYRQRNFMLLLLPQRYEFSSKSQHDEVKGLYHKSCCCYRKGTNFQANHNCCARIRTQRIVVVATAKVRIFKQITTCYKGTNIIAMLLLLPQRYEFSSKSQHFLWC